MGSEDDSSDPDGEERKRPEIETIEALGRNHQISDDEEE